MDDTERFRREQKESSKIIRFAFPKLTAAFQRFFWQPLVKQFVREFITLENQKRGGITSLGQNKAP